MADPVVENLSTEQIAAVKDTLVKSFNRDRFEMMVRRRLGIRLDDEVGTDKGFKKVVHDFVEIAVEGVWVPALVLAARTELPGSTRLATLSRQLGLDTDIPAPTTTADVDRLEKYVRARAPSVNFAGYLRRFTRLGGQLCRIEWGSVAGTGWLVAPDLVLTNYHVAQPIDKGKVSPRDVVCRFDCYAEERAGAPPVGIAVPLAEDWLVDYSVFTDSDLNGRGPDPTDQQLDYALLRLSRAIGTETTVDGEVRGSLTISRTPPPVMAGDVALVVQHAGGRPLELSFGTLLGYNGNATRVRHDANTEPGSSGSPILTVLLEPVALHHAGGPNQEFQYNQGIPLRRILDAMAAKGSVPAFWSSAVGT